MKWELPIILCGLAVVGVIQNKAPQERLADSIVFDFNERFNSYSGNTLRFACFGYERAATALLWLRFLEETPPKKMGKNQVSWIYRDLDAITDIDPDFYPAYDLGGIFLSVITEDQRGAEQLLLKGTRNLPRRWQIHKNLAYHYQFELNEPEKAAEQYEIGARLPGAPAILQILGSSAIDRRQGKAESIAFLQTMLKDTRDPNIIKRLQDKIDKLEKGEPNERHGAKNHGT